MVLTRSASGRGAPVARPVALTRRAAQARASPPPRAALTSLLASGSAEPQRELEIGRVIHGQPLAARQVEELAKRPRRTLRHRSRPPAAAARLPSGTGRRRLSRPRRSAMARALATSSRQSAGAAASSSSQPIEHCIRGGRGLVGEAPRERDRRVEHERRHRRPSSISSRTDRPPSVCPLRSSFSCAMARRRSSVLEPVDGRRAGHRPAVARDDDGLAPLHLIEQLREMRLGLEGADLSHSEPPTSRLLVKIAQGSPQHKHEGEPAGSPSAGIRRRQRAASTARLAITVTRCARYSALAWMSLLRPSG